MLGTVKSCREKTSPIEKANVPSHLSMSIALKWILYHYNGKALAPGVEMYHCDSAGHASFCRSYSHLPFPLSAVATSFSYLPPDVGPQEFPLCEFCAAREMSLSLFINHCYRKQYLSEGHVLRRGSGNVSQLHSEALIMIIAPETSKGHLKQSY